MNDFFRRCSTCKTPIAYGGRYYKCSVSTCNKKATALYFCSVPCWDAHVPDARHRDAWAEEEIAPSGPENDHDANLQSAAARSVTGTRRVVSARPAASPSEAEDDDASTPRDVLVVMSKIKGYIKAKSELRTSDGVSDPLSDHLRSVLSRAIVSAATNERTTVLARDIEAALRGENASE